MTLEPRINTIASEQYLSPYWSFFRYNGMIEDASDFGAPVFLTLLQDNEPWLKNELFNFHENHLGTFGSVGTCRKAGAGFVPLFCMMNSINSGPCLSTKSWISSWLAVPVPISDCPQTAQYSAAGGMIIWQCEQTWGSRADFFFSPSVSSRQ